jgi:SAM-dependent methyltransferase
VKESVRRSVWQSAQTGHLETWIGYAARRQQQDPARAASCKRLFAEIAAHAPFRAGERALDIGCGLDTVLDFLPDATSFTLDSLMQQLVALGLSPGIRHSAGMIEAMPFKSDSFDRVFCLNVLDHVQSPDAGLEEIARVLRGGGWLVLSVDTYAGRRYVEKRLHKWWARVRSARTKHPWVFSRADVERRLREAGLAPLATLHLAGTKERRTLFVARRQPKREAPR